MPHAVVGHAVQVGTFQNGLPHLLGSGRRMGLPKRSRCPTENGRSKACPIASSDPSVEPGIWGGHAKRHDLGLDPPVLAGAKPTEPAMVAVGPHRPHAQNSMGVGGEGDGAPRVVSIVSCGGHHEHALRRGNARSHADSGGVAIQFLHRMVGGAVVEHAVSQGRVDQIHPQGIGVLGGHNPMLFFEEAFLGHVFCDVAEIRGARGRANQGIFPHAAHRAEHRSPVSVMPKHVVPPVGHVGVLRGNDPS